MTEQDKDKYHRGAVTQSELESAERQTVEDMRAVLYKLKKRVRLNKPTFLKLRVHECRSD